MQTSYRYWQHRIPCWYQNLTRKSAFCQEFALSLGETWSDDTCREVISKLDTDKSGGIDMDEFSAWFLTSAADVASQPTARAMFAILREEAAAIAGDALLGAMADALVLQHDSLAGSLASILASKLATPLLPERALADLFLGVWRAAPHLLDDAAQDLAFIRRIDPATVGHLQPLLFFKGFHAAQAQRAAHALWVAPAAPPARRMAALALQGRVSEALGVDAHPGAVLAGGLMLDHGTGIVIGETAAVGRRCYILHGVTLGATGRAGSGPDRHPKLGEGVKVGAGAAVLGNIHVGDGVVVGAGAVVSMPIPPVPPRPRPLAPARSPPLARPTPARGPPGHCRPRSRLPALLRGIGPRGARPLPQHGCSTVARRAAAGAG
jgi:serine O-acetyltransferase